MSEVASAHWSCPDRSALVVGSTVAWNGLGFSPHQTWAFRRAELTCFAETPFFCANGKRATMGHIRTLPPRAQGEERLIAIGQRLLEGLTPQLARLRKGARVAFVLCLGDRFEDGAASDRMRAQRRQIEAALTATLRALHLELMVLVEPRGHAALAYGLREVAPAVLARKLDAVVAGGVDTAYDAEVVEELVEQKRLFDGENLDSVIPGEGGAFCVLAAPDVARQAGWNRGVALEGLAVASEPVPQSSDRPCQALGRSRVMNAVADQMRTTRRTVDWWIADVTQERYRLEEWHLAFPRATADVSNDRSRFDLLPVLLGDLGAATLPTALVLADEGLRRGDPAGSTCILSASSFTQDRGAILVSAREGVTDR